MVAALVLAASLGAAPSAVAAGEAPPPGIPAPPPSELANSRAQQAAIAVAGDRASVAMDEARADASADPWHRALQAEEGPHLDSIELRPLAAVGGVLWLLLVLRARGARSTRARRARTRVA